MRCRISLFCLIALVMSGAPIHAQTTVNSPITWVSHDIKSKTLGADRQYFVSLPQGYAAGNARYPVLVFLDANDQAQFVAALANVRFLASRAEAPEMIVVGIPNGPDRTHDLTPVTTASAEMAQFKTAGGAEAFLTFISDEVLPAVRASYRTTPGAFLAGHSFGGIFALYAAAVRPGTFNGIIAMSPSLQWNGTKYVVDYADLLAKQNTRSRLFVTSGELEPAIDINTKRFMARLDSIKHPAVDIKYAYYPQTTHGMTPQPSLVEGVRYIFEPISLRNAQIAAQSITPTTDSAAVMKILEDAQRKYGEGARTLGLSELLPEPVVNQFGYIALQRLSNKGAAVAIFKRNVANYPSSANVYDSLGDGLLAAGDTAGARAAFAKAVELGKATNDPALQESQRKLDALK